MSQKIRGDLIVDHGDFVADVTGGTRYEVGFKFPTIPFGGMTLDAKNAVRIGAAGDVKLVPAHGSNIVLGSTANSTNAAESFVTPTTDLKITPPSQATVILNTTGALPTAGASLRGALFVVQGAGGVADTLQVCLKAAGGSYSWKVIATG